MSSKTHELLQSMNRAGRNWIMMVVGETGVGKSYSAYKLGEIMDQSFNSSRICFEPTTFMEMVTELPSGSVMIFDDAGLSLSSATWWDEVNMVITWTLQSFRYKIINLIFTMPQSELLDKRARNLAHFKLHIRRQGWGRLYRIRWDHTRGKCLTPRLWDMRITLPSNMDDVRVYEDNKARWLNETYGDYLQQLTNRREEARKKLNQETPVQDLALEVTKDIGQYIDGKGKLNAGLISGQLGIGTKKSYQVRALAEKLMTTQTAQASSD